MARSGLRRSRSAASANMYTDHADWTFGLERSSAHAWINIASRRSGNASCREWNNWAIGNRGPCGPCSACETPSRLAFRAKLVSPREAWQPLRISRQNGCVQAMRNVRLAWNSNSSRRRQDSNVNSRDAARLFIRRAAEFSPGFRSKTVSPFTTKSDYERQVMLRRYVNRLC